MTCDFCVVVTVTSNHVMTCVAVTADADFDGDDKLSSSDLRELILRLTGGRIESPVERLDEQDIEQMIDQVDSGQLIADHACVCASWFRVVCYNFITH